MLFGESDVAAPGWLVVTSVVGALGLLLSETVLVPTAQPTKSITTVMMSMKFRRNRRDLFHHQGLLAEAMFIAVLAPR